MTISGADLLPWKGIICMLIKTSVACLLLVLYMLLFYYRKPHIPIHATRIFQLLTGVAFLNVLFDLITIYTVNHRAVVPGPVNLVAHIIYLLSILGFIYLLFLYLRSYLEGKLKFSGKVRLFQALPVMVSTAGILILPITYVHGKVTDYSLGPKAYALYGSIVIYLILILYYCTRYWEMLDKEKRIAIVLSVPISVTVSLIQMLMPETLLVVVASTLILLGLILSNENTEKYMDEKTNLFNQYSFEIVLEEFYSDNQMQFIAVLCFCKTETNFDWKQDVLVLCDIHKELKQRHLKGYRICENGVVFINASEEKAQAALEEVKSAVEGKYGKENISIETKVLSEEETEEKYNCMQSIIAFCAEVGNHFAYIDYLTHIYNRNALERDMANLSGNRGGYYLIADLNDLKIVNDTIGHSAGDELLQGFARLLVDVVRDAGRVYRQGGDEFAILYGKDAEPFVQELAAQCPIRNRSRNVPISYAIGYCKLSDADFLNKADQMMYENKRAIKRARKR